jgi:hypothetical protein
MDTQRHPIGIYANYGSALWVRGQLGRAPGLSAEARIPRTVEGDFGGTDRKRRDEDEPTICCPFR